MICSYTNITKSEAEAMGDEEFLNTLAHIAVIRQKEMREHLNTGIELENMRRGAV